MVRSAVKPDVIWLRDAVNNNTSLKLRVRWNIKQLEIPDEKDGVRIEYEYDEVEINHQLPESINSIETMTDYLKVNADKIIADAKNIVLIIPVPVMQLNLKTASLSAIRDAVKVTVSEVKP